MLPCACERSGELLISTIITCFCTWDQMLFKSPGDGSKILKMERRKLAHDGIERTYTLYLPPKYDGTSALPLLMLFHGGGGIGRRMVAFTGFDQIARDNGLIVVSPDGVERHWNDGRVGRKDRAALENVDDVGFTGQIFDALEKELKVDRSRVYVAGVSNGAMMSFRLALEMPDRIAAVAAVVGGLPEPLAGKQWEGRPVPLIMINGTKDPLVPYNGGDVMAAKITRGRILSAPATAAFWAKRNGCSPTPDETELKLPTNKSHMAVRKTEYKSGDIAADVVLYTVEGGGHTWPRDSEFAQYLPAMLIGKNCPDIDSTQLIWSFLQNHRTNPLMTH